MKAILIVLFALLACVVVIASCEHTIKTKLASKDSLVLESTNNNEDSIEFTFKSAEHFPMIGVKLVRQAPTSTNSSSSQQSSQSGSQSQQSGSQSSSQTTQPQPQASSGTGQMQQEQANATVSTAQQQQQQQSNSSSQAASQQSSQSSNQTQTVEKQDNPSAQSSSQAGSQGTSSTSQATTPQSSSGQNSTASSSSTSQSSQQGSSSSSQSTAQTSPVSQDNSSISGDSNMDLTPNTTQSSGQGSGSSSTGSEPANNSTTINNNTTLINETLQNIGVSNSTSKDVNITDVIGRIISGENITEIINSTLGNLTQWLNSTIDDNDNDNDNQSSQQQSKRGSLRRRLLSLLESNEESEDYAQYLKFNKLKLLSSEGETVKEIPLSDANIHWNYGHSVVVNNDQAFKVPHVDVELPLSSTSNRPTLKIRTMMTEAPSHIERNGRDIQLNPRSMDIQITLNNLHDLLSEQEKKLSGAKWSIETEMTSTANSLHLMQTKNLNSVQRVVVMGNNFAPKGQFTFNSSPNMKIIQNADNDDLISIQIQDSSNSIQLNPIKFGVH